MNTIIKAAPNGNSPFDSIRRIENGIEFWLARELMPLLGYPRWDEFTDVIDRAKAACTNAGNLITKHFSGSTPKNKTVGRPKQNVKLSRFGAYLIAMNGDPRKPEIAAAQTYFAVKTLEAETGLPSLNPFDGMADAIALMVRTEVDRRLLQIQPQPSELEQRLDIQDAEIGRIFKPDGQFFSIRGWANHRKVKINLKQASNYGRVATRLSKQAGIITDKVPDPRYGDVKVYHESILIQIIP